MEFLKVIEHGVETSCELIYQFDDTRAIVRYEGVYVFADRFSPTEWELSGMPARPGTEKEVHDRLVKELVDRGTIVTVTNLNNKVD